MPDTEFWVVVFLCTIGVSIAFIWVSFSNLSRIWLNVVRHLMTILIGCAVFEITRLIPMAAAISVTIAVIVSAVACKMLKGILSPVSALAAELLQLLRDSNEARFWTVDNDDFLWIDGKEFVRGKSGLGKDWSQAIRELFDRNLVTLSEIDPQMIQLTNAGEDVVSTL